MSSLANIHDFDDANLNSLFAGLDEKTQKEILNYPKKEFQIEILKRMNDPEIKAFYNSLSNAGKQKFESVKLREKYLMLDELVKRQKSKQDGKKIIPEIKTNTSSEKIGIIIPFRDSEADKPRTKQLAKLTEYMKTYLAGHNYKIYVIEQSNDRRKFNRGQLLNIGFELAEKDGVDNFIFHDVDLLPSPELKEYYIHAPTDKPVHIAAAWDRYNSNPNYFGGITSFNKKMYTKINGFPNNFWGWGGEDDELLKRTKKFYTILKPSKGSIQDLENLNITQKMEFLRENDLKFMEKTEHLAKHESTWKSNGLNSLPSHLNELEVKSCGSNCEIYVYELTAQSDAIIEEPNEDIFTRGVPQELFRQEVAAETEDFKRAPPSEAFNKLVKMFYDLNLYRTTQKGNTELEVRFGTKELRDVKKLTKNDYDNVVKVLKSFGFKSLNSSGIPSLRIKCEYLDRITGRFKMSDVRTEIDGIMGIEQYCKTNDIKAVYKQHGLDSRVTFTNKRPFIKPDDRKLVRPVDINDFNFRVALSTEEPVKKGVENYILENWKSASSKKEFRYLNRVTFEHEDYPVKIDMSITKTGNKGKDANGYSYIIPVSNLEESNVFSNQETYDIEIEVNNALIGPGTKFTTYDKLLVALRKVIKYVLSGLQNTMYPVSYPEQNDTLRDYMKMIWKDEYEPHRRIFSKNFIGPSSITLQLTNISQANENSTLPNIRKDFVVTEKADGDRHLMYVSKTGKIYLINMNMDVKFTGAKTVNEDCFHLLLDGELISHDKNGEFINLYAAFDIYFYKNTDIRHYKFLSNVDDEDITKSRLKILNKLKSTLHPISIVNSTTEKRAAKLVEKDVILSPIRFDVKKFYPMSAKQTIFDGCREILEKEKQGLFEYETDGLIFTHMYYGVGSNVIGKSGPKTKFTWEHSFKWKPPQYNTVDFLVTTLKTTSGEDVIKSIYEDGMDTSQFVQYDEYKIVELRCGFNEKYDGYINPCQDMIEDKIPEYKPRSEDTNSSEYMPMRFYPTEPYDPNAGIANLMLSLDDLGSKQMFAKSGEAITDNTIVEFSYDMDNEKEGWSWQPLRVRHDKTAKLRRGEREYGNSYKVCNENWKSIHPMGKITEGMLMTGANIPEVNVSEDVYYNTPSGKMKTECLKNFHNLYVKKMLISGASKQGDILIDFACGKAGDLPKWIAAKLSFVFGVDYSKDNIENRIDGACARYLNSRKINKYMPAALFVNGNSAFNIRDGSAMLNDKAKQITGAIFGTSVKDADKLGKGVAKQYGKGDLGFNVSSCQFAIHYFFENPNTLKGFLKNVAECTKINGHFIGTSYDGKILFNRLKKVATGDSIQIMDDGKKIWEVGKNYSADTFENDSSSIGYKITVYQESINQHIYEYLVNYDYFNRLMNLYGFTLISRDEANAMGLPSGTGLFSELFINMLDEIKRNKFKASSYGEAPNMSTFEKEISFLNRYFVYKKVRDVNVDKLTLELSEYEESVEKETSKPKPPVEPTTKSKPKVRKLSTKMILVPATEAVEESVVAEPPKAKPKTKTKTVKSKTTVKKPAEEPPKQLLIIEEDSDEDN